jgi:uncharacterized protein (DUF885 family)
MRSCVATLMLLTLLLTIVGGCAIATTPASNPYPAWLYQNVKAPVDAENGVEAVKEGKACVTNILGIVATGDASIDEAKRAGGIKEIASVDYQVNSVLGIYARFCTIVKGK